MTQTNGTDSTERFGQLTLIAPPTADECEEARLKRAEQRRTRRNAARNVLTSAGLAQVDQLAIDFDALVGMIREFIDDEDELATGLFDDVDPIDLHLWIMKMSLGCLEDGRAGRRQRDEVMSWVLVPFEREGGQAEAFTFETCCRCGDADPYEMQELLIGRYAPHLMELAEAYVP